jgi:hypothetical protein
VPIGFSAAPGRFGLRRRDADIGAGFRFFRMT